MFLSVVAGVIRQSATVDILTTVDTPREDSPAMTTAAPVTEFEPGLQIECPVCTGTGWVTAVRCDRGYQHFAAVRRQSALTIACPVCNGRSWVQAVSE